LKDTKKILRLALFNALDGNVTYNSNPVVMYEEKLPSGQNPDMFILLSNQQETSSDENDGCFITKSSIDIEILHKTGSDVSKDDIDDVYEQIMEILIPEPFTLGGTVTVPAQFQFHNPYRESCITNTVVLSETETVITERLKIVFTITQK
jgi:hypothetical protein